MNEKDFAELAAGHALNALSSDDEQTFVDALAAHQEWNAQLRSDQEVVAFLAEGVADVSPPLTARSEVLRRVAALASGGDSDAPDAEASTPPVPGISAADAALLPPGSREDGTTPDPAPDTNTVQTIARRNWTRGIFALAASFVLLLGLGFGAVLISEQVNKPVSVVALDQIQSAPDAQVASIALDGGGSATVHWSSELGKTVLVSDGLPALAPQEAFEMWFVRDDTPVAAGVFTPGPDGDATAVLNGAMQEGDVIAVTVEPAGGSPTGVPSTDPIIAIPTA
nr:anti-sigma factor [Microbacterium lemovicicum]